MLRPLFPRFCYPNLIQTIGHETVFPSPIATEDWPDTLALVPIAIPSFYCYIRTFTYWNCTYIFRTRVVSYRNCSLDISNRFVSYCNRIVSLQRFRIIRHFHWIFPVPLKYSTTAFEVTALSSFSSTLVDLFKVNVNVSSILWITSIWFCWNDDIFLFYYQGYCQLLFYFQNYQTPKLRSCIVVCELSLPLNIKPLFTAVIKSSIAFLKSSWFIGNCLILWLQQNTAL